MAARKKQSRPRRIIKPVGGCPFCKERTQPSYKSPEGLQAFITDRAKIISRARSGVCAKHQRRLTREIKRARHLALLPFAVRPA